MHKISSQGEQPITTAISQISKAFMLAAGFLFLLYFVLIFTDPFLPRVVDKDGLFSTCEKIQITNSGHYYVMKPMNENQFEPFTPEGKPILESTWKDPDPKVPPESINPGPPEHYFDELPKLKTLPSHELKVFANQPNILEYWYLVQHRHPFPHGYFEGFDSLTGRSLGYIGNSGLIDHCPTPDESLSLLGIQQGEVSPPRSAGNYNAGSLPSKETDPQSWDFQLSTQRRVWVATTVGIQVCDLPNRTVKPFAPVKDLLFLDVLRDNNKRRFWVLGRTAETIQLFDENGKPAYRANHPYSPKAGIRVFALESGQLVVVQTKVPKPGAESIEATVYWYDKSGTLINQKEHTLNIRVFPTNMGREIPLLSINNITQSFLGALGVLFSDTDSVPEEGSFFSAKLFPYVLCNFGLTLTCLLLVLWRQKQRGHGFWPTLGWVVFTLVLGAAGYFGYLFHKRWPKLVSWPSCSKKRPVNRIHCPGCGADFVKPPLTGNEILSPEPIRLMAQIA